MSAIRVERVDVDLIFDSPLFDGLAHEYSKECRVGMLGSGEPTVNRAAYRGLQAVGLMETFAAYDGDELCGFAAVVKNPSLHLSIDVAVLDAVYVAPKSRARIGLYLLHVVEDFVRTEWKVPALVVNARVLSSLDNMMLAMVRHGKAEHTYNSYMIAL